MHGFTARRVRGGVYTRYLSDFAVHVTENRRKKGAATNMGNMPASYVSHVRTYYEFRLDPPRRVGGAGASVKHATASDTHCGDVRRGCVSGTIQPSEEQEGVCAEEPSDYCASAAGYARPVQRDGASVHVYVAWQDGRQSGKLMRSNSRTGPWNAKFDMHRGRACEIGVRTGRYVTGCGLRWDRTKRTQRVRRATRRCYRMMAMWRSTRRLQLPRCWL